MRTGDLGVTGAGGEGRWVFGYGSLMWRPGFAFLERVAAMLHGRRRAFCIYSVHHRGTPARPGTGSRPRARRVHARGGLSCGGGRLARVYAYLLEREQPTETYIEASVHVGWLDGRRVEALAFLSDMTHPQWAGGSSRSPGRADRPFPGLSGRNIDYLRELVEHLHQDGVRDAAWSGCWRGLRPWRLWVRALRRSGPR